MRVLAIGAHPDDIELGCGGTLLRHRSSGDDVVLLVMTTGERGPQDSMSRVLEQQRAARLLGADLQWGGFDDGAVDGGTAGTQVVEQVLRWFRPDVVYTHSVQDTHQDHRATAQATLSATRRHCRVLHYRSPSTLNFCPQVFVDIDGLVEAKLELIRAHGSQVAGSSMIDLDVVEAEARCQGFQARVRAAEGFTTERFLWDPFAGRTTQAAEQSEVDASFHELEAALELWARER
jgi:LmbE family N-acetylglucosaminyl deacetylase